MVFSTLKMNQLFTLVWKKGVIWFILGGWDQIQNIRIEDTFWDYPTFKGHNVKAIVRNEPKLKEGLEKDHDIKDHENLNIIKVIMAISVVEFQVGDTKLGRFMEKIIYLLRCNSNGKTWKIREKMELSTVNFAVLKF